MSIFGDIPVRINGQLIEASWFNTIRSKLLQAFGDVEGEVAQAIGQGQVSQDITTLTFSSADFSSVDIEYTLRRETDSDEVFVRGGFTLQYMKTANTWRLKEGEFRGDDVGVTFDTLDDTGTPGINIVQVRYSSDTLAGGSYAGNIVTKYTTWGVI